jgi:hypothetical protein
VTESPTWELSDEQCRAVWEKYCKVNGRGIGHHEVMCARLNASVPRKPAVGGSAEPIPVTSAPVELSEEDRASLATVKVRLAERLRVARENRDDPLSA